MFQPQLYFLDPNVLQPSWKSASHFFSHMLACGGFCHLVQRWEETSQKEKGEKQTKEEENTHLATIENLLRCPYKSQALWSTLSDSSKDRRWERKEKDNNKKNHYTENSLERIMETWGWAWLQPSFHYCCCAQQCSSFCVELGAFRWLL